jgi:hypothetical protein
MQKPQRHPFGMFQPIALPWTPVARMRTIECPRSNLATCREKDYSRDIPTGCPPRFHSREFQSRAGCPRSKPFVDRVAHSFDGRAHVGPAFGRS